MQSNMMTLKAAVAAFFTAAGAFLGWQGVMIVVWVVMMLLDYLTGTFAAVKAGQWSSAVARQGLWHKGGMIVVVVNLLAEDGSVITGPDIITRGFIYVKESEELMESLQEVALEAIERCQRKRVRDWSSIKSAIKNDLSGYLYKTTKRNPMILPVITEI